ncbi:MAG TPA: hypothetical protein VL995_11480 [Cellvibrio sp.]|nr:hypothetical protein [Cellvibrio sp.]
MAKALDVAVLDAALDRFATSINVSLCSNQPANFAGIAAVRLAAGVHTAGAGNGSFTKSAGDVSGRKITIAALNNLSITASGTCNHVAYDDGTTLLCVATCSPQALTSGGTVSLGTHKIEIQAPV